MSDLQKIMEQAAQIEKYRIALQSIARLSSDQYAAKIAQDILLETDQVRQ